VEKIGLISILFAVERLGTAKVGVVFGPIMLLWFGTLGVLGLAEVLHNPRVLAALDPVQGLSFLIQNKGIAIAILGAVVLSVPVNHRPRLQGTSKYGLLNRLWVGVVDILGVMWLQSRFAPGLVVEEDC
jgi:hypothetical protein